MFLWVCGAPQSVRQGKNRFRRSLETISRTFDRVLTSVLKLADDIIKPKDPEFSTVHPFLNNPKFSPHFNDCTGALDGTHVKVVVPKSLVVQHMNRHNETSQNVLVVCDFDMRFTFVLSGWPGSVHDMRVFTDATTKYTHKFPHPPPGKYYMVDARYPNRPGYLSPYRRTRYHVEQWQNGPPPQGHGKEPAGATEKGTRFEELVRCQENRVNELEAITKDLQAELKITLESAPL